MLTDSADLWQAWHYTAVGPACVGCGGPILSDEGVVTLHDGSLRHTSCNQTLRHQLRAWQETAAASEHAQISK